VTERAKHEAEKFRLHILNVALAAKGSPGDLRKATDMLIEEIAKSLDKFANHYWEPSK
jgi:ribosome-associated translation inhibitor RaiA